LFELGGLYLEALVVNLVGYSRLLPLIVRLEPNTVLLPVTASIELSGITVGEKFKAGILRVATGALVLF